jgi:hypothetical protein
MNLKSFVLAQAEDDFAGEYTASGGVSEMPQAVLLVHWQEPGSSTRSVCFYY